ncbi:MAG: sigma 54-dependent transcriptional regulator, partial [Myxococcales bacterium]|nr:sigma 54-dependent transcriptional regulator [Myxococcales bacterium]
REGTFRPDLLARIDLWTFRLPSLRERVEDIAPNVEHESARVGRLLGRNVTWTREARDAYLAFATSPRAAWPGNFRDLGASVTRLATLATEGRITRERVLEEIAALEARSSGVPQDPSESLVDRVLPGVPLDRFDAVQLADVLRVCKEARTLSEAGRVLFAASRSKKAKSNDADRLRKYLARFGLEFVAVREALASGG